MVKFRIVKKLNDMLARYVSEQNEKFLGLAVVPPWGDEESLDEIERSIKDLGLPGVQCAAHYGTLYLDNEEFEPYFKKLNQLSVPVCVHHTPLPVEYSHIYKYTNLRRFYRKCSDQIISLSRILFSGILDKFPNLKLMHTQKTAHLRLRLAIRLTLG